MKSLVTLYFDDNSIAEIFYEAKETSYRYIYGNSKDSVEQNDSLIVIYLTKSLDKKQYIYDILNKARNKNIVKVTYGQSIKENDEEIITLFDSSILVEYNDIELRVYDGNVEGNIRFTEDDENLNENLRTKLGFLFKK